jgi:cytochrome c biogenesis protein CcmG/thiol:disulfide interchange protein DsbE
MRVNLTRIIIFGFIFFCLSIFWLGLKKDQSYDTRNLIGNKINEFNIPSLDETNSFSEQYFLNNKFTIVNFFASWCAPCRDEHKYLVELSKNGAHIVGVSFKDKKSNTLDFLNQLGNPYKFIAADNDGKASISFGIYGIPESIIINRESVVVKKIIGPINQEIFKEILNIIK